MGKKLQNNAT